MTISKEILSESIDGRGILVVATSSPGTTIHTGPNTATTTDEVWIYASNPDSISHLITLQWGATTSPNDYISVTVPAYQGLYIVAPGLLIKGNATPLVVRAFADLTNKVTLFGYVNRIVQ